MAKKNDQQLSPPLKLSGGLNLMTLTAGSGIMCYIFSGAVTPIIERALAITLLVQSHRASLALSSSGSASLMRQAL